MEEQLSSDRHLNFNHQEFVRTYRECLAWASLLFAENSSLKILRHLILLWSGHSWSSAVLNCAAVSGREGTSVPALTRLLLVGSGTYHAMAPAVITFEAAKFAYQHRCCHPRTICLSSKGPTLSADIQLLVEGLILRITNSVWGTPQLDLDFTSFISSLPGTIV